MSIDQIFASLNHLSSAVDFLEREVVRIEAEKARASVPAQPAAKAAQPASQPAGKSLPGLPGQNDLFGEWTAPGARPANRNAAAALAKKLDNAIENVQWLLKEKA